MQPLPPFEGKDFFSKKGSDEGKLWNSLITDTVIEHCWNFSLT